MSEDRLCLPGGNGDAHAKNFSVVQDPTGEWRIAPAYDLPSTYPYRDTTMAIARAGMLIFADTIGLSRRAATKTLEDLTAGADDWLDHIDELPFDARRRHDLRRFLRYRQDELRRR